MVDFFITLAVDYYINGWYVHEPKAKRAELIQVSLAWNMPRNIATLSSTAVSEFYML